VVQASKQGESELKRIPHRYSDSRFDATMPYPKSEDPGERDIGGKVSGGHRLSATDAPMPGRGLEQTSSLCITVPAPDSANVGRFDARSARLAVAPSLAVTIWTVKLEEGR